MNPEFILFIARASLMAIPLYLCNSMALVFGGRKPIDFGKNFFDGKRLLGDGKTIKGTIAGIAIGSAAALALSISFPTANALLNANYAFYGSLLAVGAVAGDFAGSFLKRRRGIARGKSVFLLDQLGFVVAGLAFGCLLAQPTALEFIFLLAFTTLAHVIGNRIAFIAKIKKVPW